MNGPILKTQNIAYYCTNSQQKITDKKYNSKKKKEFLICIPLNNKNQKQ